MADSLAQQVEHRPFKAGSGVCPIRNHGRPIDNQANTTETSGNAGFFYLLFTAFYIRLITFTGNIASYLAISYL